MSKTIRVKGAVVKGQTIAGDFPLLHQDTTHAIFKHAVHGNVRVPLALTELPGAAPVTLTYDELKIAIRARFNMLDRLMDGVIGGRIRSVIVSGPPGIGKTHTVETRLAAAKAAGTIKDYRIVRGTISPLGAYLLLWEFREAGKVIVLDDADDLLNEEVGVNIIKAATDTGKTRQIAYMKELALFENKGIPNNFEYKGSLIIASNLDFDSEVDSKSKRAPHLDAIMSRAIYLDLGAHSRQGLMARVQDICETTPMLTDIGLDKTQIGILLGWMADNRESLRSVSLRTAIHLGGMILSDPQHWRPMAKATLLSARRRK